MFNTIFMYLLYVAPEIARLSYFVMSFLLPIAGLLMLQSSLATTTREARDSARAFREMFESVQEVFVRMDQHGTLVDVSPSTVTRLKVFSTLRCTNALTMGPETLASVAIYASMVAIFGLIMPEPLAIPVIVTVWPSI